MVCLGWVSSLFFLWRALNSQGWCWRSALSPGTWELRTAVGLISLRAALGLWKDDRCELLHRYSHLPTFGQKNLGGILQASQENSWSMLSFLTPVTWIPHSFNSFLQPLSLPSYPASGITVPIICWVGHKVYSGFSVLRCYGLLWVLNELCGQSDIYTWVSFRVAHAKIFRDICSLHLKVLLSSASSKRKYKNVEDCIQGIHGADVTAAHILLARIHSRGRLRNTASLSSHEEKEVATQ